MRYKAMRNTNTPITINLSYHGSKGFVNTPSGSYSCSYRFSLYSSFFSPFRKALGFPTVLYNSICSRISGLFYWCSPTAVFFTIIAVVINTVYRCLSFSIFCNMIKVRIVHIVSKLLKRIPKTFYSAPSIYGKPVTSAVVAPNRYVSECNPKPAMRHAMSLKYISRIIIDFLKTTTTTCRLTSNHMTSFCYSFLSAVARKFPNVTITFRRAFFNLYKSDSSQSPIFLSYYVSFIHNFTKKAHRLVSSVPSSHTRLIMNQYYYA